MTEPSRQLARLVPMLEAVYRSKQAGLGRLVTRIADLQAQHHDLDHPDYAPPDSTAARAGANLRWDTWVEQRKTLINRELIEAARQREAIRADVAQSLARLEAARKALDRARTLENEQSQRRASW